MREIAGISYILKGSPLNMDSSPEGNEWTSLSIEALSMRSQNIDDRYLGFGHIINL